MSQIFKKSFIVVSCIFSMQMVHADHLLTCPAAETLSTYTYGVALPYAYNQQAKETQFVSVALEPAAPDSYAHLGLVVYPVSVSFSEEPEAKMQALIHQLTLETPNPVNYRIAAHETLPLCIYTIPGKNKVTAFLLGSDGEDTEDHLFSLKSQKPMSRSEQAMKFLKLTHWS